MRLTSKQIEELRAYAADRKGELAKLINDAADIIELLSARKTGMWISDGVRFKGGHEWMHCSECGLEALDTPLKRTNYCQNCGARMENPGETRRG